MLWWTLKELGSENAIRRIGAVRKLAASTDPRAIEALIAALDDPAESVEKEARKALLRIGKPATKQLVAALSHASDRRRVNAAILLRRVVPDVREWSQAEAVYGVFVETLRHADPSFRRCAVEELGAIGDVRALGALAAVLCDKNFDIRSSARDAIEAIIAAKPSGTPGNVQDWKSAQEAIPALVETLRQQRPGDLEYETAGKVLEHMGSGAIPPLLELLNRAGDTLLRVAVLTALGCIQDVNVLHTLTMAVRDSSPWIRTAGARALARHRHPMIKDSLLPLLKDRDMGVRLAAAEALKEVLPPGDRSLAIPSLLEVLRDKASPMKQRAAVLLGEIADPCATAELVNALGDKEPSVRKAAEEALLRIGSRSAQYLIVALHKSDSEVRCAAVRLLSAVARDQ
ncbi:MAG: hypothetical protein FJW35_18910, partial [Acidobacteria bacterium]|nr:hypothetical protein [Acidobacteriota bacterium]